MLEFKNEAFGTIQGQPSGEGAQTPPEQLSPAFPYAPGCGRAQPPDRQRLSDLVDSGELL